ncbi:hypothetical protein [Adlercreutzia sp. ZJ304]|uniref:hypothetical protein n=1 Tax=Adlercreutzia sp. ZJ304 TaxID=2709791 RepID=UPI0013EA705C|nr:hypothetical protein [Adlercreutzia sp. ZJ304]
MSYTTVTEPKQKGKGKKALTAGLAVTLALAIGVPATFAAVVGATTSNVDENELASYTGARLHDDFAGFKNEEGKHDKNVYFENFAEESDTIAANPVLVRVKLTHEYTTRDKTTSTEVVAAGSALTPNYAANNITVTMGGSGEYYMPTFNKQINDPANDVRSINNNPANYKDWANEEAISEAGKDYNGNTIAATEHKAKAIPDCQVYASVADWETAKAANPSLPAAWVYDADSANGYYYWSEPLNPGKVTGLLINDAVVNSTGGWTYTIDVQGTYADINEPCVKEGQYYFDKDAIMPMSEGIYNMLAKSLGRINATQSAAIATAEIGSGEVTIDDTKFTIIGRNEKTREAVLLTSQENKVDIDTTAKPIEDGVSFDKTWVNAYINSAETDGWLANKPTIASCAVAKDYAYNNSGNSGDNTIVKQKITLPTLGDTDDTFISSIVGPTFANSTGLNMPSEMLTGEAIVKNLFSNFNANTSLLVSSASWMSLEEGQPLNGISIVYLDPTDSDVEWMTNSSPSHTWPICALPMFVIRY